MKNYYDSYVPYYNNPQNQSTFQNKDELMKKLNYLIHLMEEIKMNLIKMSQKNLFIYVFRRFYYFCY